ncbi:DUF4328 domain-containing protein [Sphingomonas sanguinis]|uniref:DUF4328 domain-containing protein n=1 Tax=Sphingomonas sp. LC-1 TaxID=3110957 RepID=UPI0021BA6B4A|nr:DUF4328 domain-containing protein [Sphingomonas sp. LC-1]MCT8001911.1 DUF4328 domain-containing protein [Sphingomonas sp. LC-1]
MLKDPDRSTRWTLALTCLWLLGSLGQTTLYLWRISVLHSAAITPEAVDRVIEGQVSTLDLFALLTLFYHLVFFRWVYIVNRNAQQWNSAMTISPGWNVGWFFMPIAALWKPFEGIRETRGVTIAPEAPAWVSVPIWLKLWWGLWIAAAIYGNMTVLFLAASETSDQWISMSGANVARIAIDVPLAVLTCQLLTDISTLQSQRIAAAERAAVAGGTPPAQR